MAEINFVPKFLEAALTPVGKEVGERLSDLISLAFTPLIKLKAKRDVNLELFTKSLKMKIENIPENKLVEPQAHIVSPLLEKLGKHYHGIEYLREMFATLIASSMNVDKASLVHPSYGNIIEQLTSADATILQSLFYRQKIGGTTHIYDGLTLIAIHGQCGDVYYFEDLNILYLEREESNTIINVIDIPENNMSISNLNRLGLVTIENADNEMSTYNIHNSFEKLGFKLLTDENGRYNIFSKTLGFGNVNIIYLYLRPTKYCENFMLTCSEDVDA